MVVSLVIERSACGPDPAKRKDSGEGVALVPGLFLQTLELGQWRVRNFPFRATRLALELSDNFMWRGRV